MSSLASAVGAVLTDPAGRVLLCQQRQGHRLWVLPGGRIRNDETPMAAAVRDIREETGMETQIVDLVGLYQVTGDSDDARGEDLPDVLMHVFRGRCTGDATVNAPAWISRLSWHEAAMLPEPTTATTRAAIEDALAGRSGVLRTLRRDGQ
ncbi:NUDIX hydrolase [Natronosporangium hydrolyticum]|uniref:NUDIX hydrolase n=1 Tax=Natronosporangium hydrolyticum TaxID=2811111 RepID=A0A895YK21_9ACTN|nr:NUDIX hydrolase [Natronosporangium hydrolyticum]QSB16382.1 NUDIX hydrolase [Natronosporangium hydrolyticum]